MFRFSGPERRKKTGKEISLCMRARRLPASSGGDPRTSLSRWPAFPPALWARWILQLPERSRSRPSSSNRPEGGLEGTLTGTGQEKPRLRHRRRHSGEKIRRRPPIFPLAPGRRRGFNALHSPNYAPSAFLPAGSSRRTRFPLRCTANTCALPRQSARDSRAAAGLGKLGNLGRAAPVLSDPLRHGG
jgi:hypothetical protein